MDSTLGVFTVAPFQGARSLSTEFLGLGLTTAPCPAARVSAPKRAVARSTIIGGVLLVTLKKQLSLSGSPHSTSARTATILTVSHRLGWDRLEYGKFTNQCSESL